MEFAIYGGRVDNVFDVSVMVSYLTQFFDSSIISEGGGKNKKVGPLKVPGSTNYKEYTDIIEGLPENDTPSYFGLPENIERSAQRIYSAAVISALRILKRADSKSSKFDKDLWSNELGPILNIWKKLNEGSKLVSMKISPPSDKSGKQTPLEAFILLEKYNAVKLVQSVHGSLAALSKVIRGTQLLTKDVASLADALMNQETPLSWLSQWDGPEDPMKYLTGLVARALAIQKWVDAGAGLLSKPLDLAELFHSDTFLNALRQQTAREMKCSMDTLKFVCKWNGAIDNAKLTIKLCGIQLEGCVFNGSHLTQSQRDSPSFTEVPAFSVAWIHKESPDPYQPNDMISLPLYFSAERERLVTKVQTPCKGEHATWLQCGAALFLRSF